ncbi:hypothetical protein RIE95_02170 [Acidithiobacillus thiooxidans]|uniref:hypothetical protein n=1 Tax=Acidithiobacillus thiooxidans TaxID=930 RepID=UPI00285A28A6|nr:hypothetical protein [Acidithiobacillus thiooxidans]MDR7925811.1 hypothetical protein [Acidithiobacillus thiooxidans]
MSTSLNLVIYRTKDEKLIEEDLKTVRCEEVSGLLLEKINSIFPMIKREVYFDESLEESFEIECFSSSDIDGVCALLEEIFLDLLKFENNNLNNKTGSAYQENESTKLVADIVSGESESNPIELAVVRFHVLTGIIGIFADVRNKFCNEVGAVIKLG